MSKYKIYRVDSSDPKIIGNQSKKLVLAYSILFLITYITIDSNLIIKKLHFSKLTYYIFFSILILASIIVVFIIIRQIKKLKKIGTLEFTQTKIKKEIGDLRTEIPFKSILKIEIDKHLRALTVFQSKTGSVTYIIRIIQNDLKEDLFIISEKSVDFGQNISLLNTLNTIKRIANLNVIMNKN